MTRKMVVRTHARITPLPLCPSTKPKKPIAEMGTRRDGEEQCRAVLAKIREQKEEMREQLHRVYPCVASGRRILEAVRKCTDSWMFEKDPRSLTNYTKAVDAPPMWLQRLGEWLSSFDDQVLSKEKVIRLFRSIWDNAYKYNGETSSVAEAARRIEKVAEELFVSEFQEPRAIQEIKELIKLKDVAKDDRIKDIVKLYDKCSEGAVNIGKLSEAAQKRILRRMKEIQKSHLPVPRGHTFVMSAPPPHPLHKKTEYYSASAPAPPRPATETRAEVPQRRHEVIPQNKHGIAGEVSPIHSTATDESFDTADDEIPFHVVDDEGL